MADLIDCGELTPGKVFIDKGELYSVVDIAHNKTAMAKMKHKIKAKNLRTGAIVEMMKFGGDRVEAAFLDKVTMEYLYADDDFGYFMNKDTFDQIQIPKERIKWELQFLAPNSDVVITYFGSEILGIQLPAKVALQVTDTDDNAVAGDTVNRATKDAVLETGFKLRVPLFVKQGEKVIVRTDTGEYDSRTK
ncbi:MAG TPA: elongation factor P [Firmicutes bacterium]|nr:elongation factor P [Bacillota bacterium]